MADESVKTTFSAFGDVFAVSPVFSKTSHQYVMETVFCLCPFVNPSRHLSMSLVFNAIRGTLVSSSSVLCVVSLVICPVPVPSDLCRRCNQSSHVARECVRAWGQPRPPYSVPVSSPPDSAPVPVSLDVDDLSSVSWDCTDPSIAFEDPPRRPRV